MNRVSGRQPPAARTTPRITRRHTRRPPLWPRRLVTIGACIALLAPALGSLPAHGQSPSSMSPATRSAGASNAGTAGPDSRRPLPTDSNAGAPPASEVRESLSQSIELRRAFPFQPRCDGNTQEMVACLWQQRDHDDLRLQRRLANELELERWRQARLAVCRHSADRSAGGSIRPLLRLECENALNSTLIEQITTPQPR